MVIIVQTLLPLHVMLSLTVGSMHVMTLRYDIISMTSSPNNDIATTTTDQRENHCTLQ